MKVFPTLQCMVLLLPFTFATKTPKSQKPSLFEKTPISNALDDVTKIVKDLANQVHIWKGNLLGAAEMLITSADVVSATTRASSAITSTSALTAKPSRLQVAVVSLPEWALQFLRLLDEVKEMRSKWTAKHDSNLVYRQLQVYQQATDILLARLLAKVPSDDGRKITKLVQPLKQKMESASDLYKSTNSTAKTYVWKLVL